MSLVERLRSRGTFAGGPGFFHNPDGPEAAAQLEAMQAFLRRFIEIEEGTDRTGFDAHVEQLLMDLAVEVRASLNKVGGE